jgi:hypothetical protein
MSTEAERDFSSYVANVLQPIIKGTTDDGELAVWLTRQLDEWELEAERPEGLPWAPLAVDAIERALKR